MCDPVTILTAAGSLMSAGATVQQGLSTAAVARYNAKVERNAGYQNELLTRDKAQRDIASQTLDLGAQGTRVDSGTPLLLLSESARNAELDALEIRRGALARSASYESQAKNATTGAIFGAGAQLLAGGTKLAELGKLNFGSSGDAPKAAGGNV